MKSTFCSKSAFLEFFPSDDFLTWPGHCLKCFFSAKKLWSDLWKSIGPNIFWGCRNTFELSLEEKIMFIGFIFAALCPHEVAKFCIFGDFCLKWGFFHGKKLNITKNWLFSTKNYFFENCSEMSTITPKVLKNEFLGVFDAYFTTNTCVNIQSPTSPKSQDFVVSTMKCCDFGLVGEWMFTQVFVVK